MDCHPLPPAERQPLAQVTNEDVPGIGLAAAAQPLTHAQEDQARVSLLKEIKLSDDWRVHAWILSHCFGTVFPEPHPGHKRALRRAKFDGYRFRVASV
jgi:hypothetical protein